MSLIFSLKCLFSEGITWQYWSIFQFLNTWQTKRTPFTLTWWRLNGNVFPAASFILAWKLMSSSGEQRQLQYVHPQNPGVWTDINLRSNEAVVAF